MLMPKRVKHRKVQRGRRAAWPRAAPPSLRRVRPAWREEVCWLTSRQIEAARRAMTHHIKRGGRVWIRVFPDKPVTKKPAEVRMGSGKGAPDHWVAVVKPGRVMFEIVRRAGADRAARRCASPATSCRSTPGSSMKEGARPWNQSRSEGSRDTGSRAARSWMRSRSCGISASTSPPARKRTTAGCRRPDDGSLASSP